MEAAQTAAESPDGQVANDDLTRPLDTLRVLIPSPLGNLGIEFCGTTVTSLVVVPKPGERKNYLTLTEVLKDSSQIDFLEEALGRFSEYFAGARRDLRLDWRLPDSEELDDTARRVLLETSKIRYGETMVYQKLASSSGLGESYRLVRSILMSNPLPILIPCHRVIPRKGGAGSWIAGTKKKEWLLKMEARTDLD